MCTVSPPPLLAPAWPWQAPGDWLDFAVILALSAVACALVIPAIRRQPVALRRRLGWVLLLPGALCFLTSVFLGFVVVAPANDALLAWIPRPDQGCSTEVWQPVFERASQRIQEVHELGLNLLVVGIILLCPVSLLCPLELHTTASRTRE